MSHSFSKVVSLQPSYWIIVLIYVRVCVNSFVLFFCHSSHKYLGYVFHAADTELCLGLGGNPVALSLFPLQVGKDRIQMPRMRQGLCCLG